MPDPMTVPPRWDVEHDCEGNTFITADLNAEDMASTRAQLEADPTVSNIRVRERKR